MSENEWLELRIGDVVNSNTAIACKGMIVSEICEDNKSLDNWKKKGFTQAKRLIKFVKEGTIYHTWDVSCENWSKA
jgi:hypothetical protein